MKKFTEPIFSPLNPKAEDMKNGWRVRFNYLHDDKWIRFSFSQGINRIKDYGERLAQAEVLKNLLTNKLKFEGWNPVTDTYNPEVHPEVDQQIKAMQQMSLEDAMSFVFGKRKDEWTRKTQQDYSSMLKYLKKAAMLCKLHDKGVHLFQGAHFKLLLETVEKVRNLSHKGYNKYRDYLSTLVGEMVQWDIIQHNYIHNIRLKKEPKTLAHQPPDDNDRVLIVNHIKKEHPDYFMFLCLIYGCTLRPKEILGLKVSDIDFRKQTIRLKAENAKTGTERNVALPNWVKDMLEDFLIRHPHKPHHYLFTSNGQGTFLPGWKTPGKNMAHRTWKILVKEGLGLETTQYSLKKLAGNDMIKLQQERGVLSLLELPRVQMGHSNSRQTEVYVTEHKKAIDKVIRDYMPEL